MDRKELAASGRKTVVRAGPDAAALAGHDVR